MLFCFKEILMKKSSFKFKSALFVSLLLATAFSQSLLFAKQNAAADDEKAEVLTAIETKMTEKINVDFRETPIEDVLRMLAKQADVDIVKSPAVIGNVTATLTDIPLAEALDNILAVHGYGYIATENMIRILPRAEIYNAPEKMVNRVYRITYADVKELEKALKKFMTSRGSLSAMPGTSNIIVTDTETTVEAIDKFIEEVDRVTQQVLVEVRIYDVTDTDDFNFDIKWNAGRITENLSGEPITETTGNGIPYTDELAGGAAATGTPLQTTSKRADPFAAGSFDKTNGGSVRLGFFNNSVNLDVFLTALEKKQYATLLANPSIMVLDNETATFEIVEEIPYKEESSTSGGGQMTSTRFKDVGVKLVVTPHITRDNMLRLHLIPEFGVSEAQQRNKVTNEPIVPTVNTRKLDTIALLRNGATVVLGGLRKQEVSKILSKVPLLGDIPLLGGLFRSESENTITTEVLVFITPRIIDVAVLSAEEAKNFEYTNIRSVKYPPLRNKKLKQK
jgi:type IV pilus assembly protein PilQ